MYEMRAKCSPKDRKALASVIRKTAAVVNLLVLVPYGMFGLSVAFGGDYSPWPFALYALGVLVLGGLTASGLLVREPVELMRLILGSSVPFHIWLLIHSIVGLFDKPAMVSWSSEIFYATPVIIGPLLSLLAIASLWVVGSLRAK